jgi:2,4-dienoyl-CoA reductase-like NADH-dependent reductase (Old Yellow Enzyme family)
MGRHKSVSGQVFSAMFSPFRLETLHLKNRLVALPVFSGYACPDGKISSLLVEHYKQLAGSGVSLVVVANAAVDSDGVTARHNLRVDRDDDVSGLARLAAAIQQEGALACLQLNHAGRFAKTDRPLLPSAADSENLAFNMAALKDFMNFFPLEKRFELTRYFLKLVNSWRRAMTAEDQSRIVADFGDAAIRAYKAGFDLIELHGANGYLLCQFLSAFTNKISPGFGGGFDHRTRFPLAVVREVKKRLPEGFPIGFRLLLREGVPGGVDMPESLAFAELLEQEGISYLSASIGSYNSIFSSDLRNKMNRPAYLRAEMKKLKQMVKVPTIISGRIIHPRLADELVREKVADLIGLGRPLRTDFNWVKKAAANRQDIMTCINCNWCLKRVVLEQGFNCRRWPRLRQQQTDFGHKLLSRNYSSLWLIADRIDFFNFMASLPFLFTERLARSTADAPTIFFLQTEDREQNFDSDRENFLKWSAEIMSRFGLAEKFIHRRAKRSEGAAEEVVRAEISRGRYGLILIGHNRNQAWRERILYNQRRKVIGFLNSSARQSNMLIPLDLSETTLLVLSFLRHAYMGHPGFDLNFVHVSKDPKGPLEQRWKELKKIVGFDKDAQLQILPSQGDIATDLLSIINTGGFGTIIMGKRGFSGIKRWLLGSVSAGVLRGITNQTLFLVD